MRKLVDGVLMDMSAEEIAALPQPTTLVVALRLIAPLAFRRRLGQSRMTLTIAAAQALASGDPTLQVMLDDIASAQVVDLDDAELVGGLAMLVQIGLLTSAQRDAMLLDGEPSERPSA